MTRTKGGIEQRKQIASAAARLIAEEGIGDYTAAKRKALRRLGLPDNAKLPENEEIEDELRVYQRLFQDAEQTDRITYLRRKACEIMSIMGKYSPYLTGSVLDGTAGRYAEVDILLFTDSAKDVEIFLLNQKIDYQHSVPRSNRVEAVLTLLNEDVVINLVVYPAHEERVTFKTRNGKVRRRIRLDALNKLIETESLVLHEMS